MGRLRFRTRPLVTLRRGAAAPWHDAWSWRSSPSPTVAPGSRSPRTRSRRSGARSTPGATGSRPTCGSRPTARSCAPTIPSSAGACAAARSRSTHGRRARGLRRAPPGRRLRRARHRVRVLGRREDGRGGAGRSSRSPARTTRSSGSGCARPTSSCCGRCADEPAVKLVHSRSARRHRGAARTPRVRPRRDRHRRDEPAPHRMDGRAGVAVPPLRRARVRVGHAGGAPPPRRAQDGHRRGLLRPSRPHGRDRRASGRPISETCTRAPYAARRATTDRCRFERPDAEEHAADDVVSSGS